MAPHKVHHSFRRYLARTPGGALLLGFSSGLPFMLTANTLGFWLRDRGLALGTISALSWVGLAYSLKFLWAPVVDRVDLPLLARFGRRRGWMLAAQVMIAAGLLGMAALGPEARLAPFVALAVLVAFSSATQDIVVDAWRIEAADGSEELGLLTAAYQLGYRIALLATMSWVLILAQFAGWNISYVAMAAAMSVGVFATSIVREPTRADAVMRAKSDAAPLWSPRGFFDALAGPFVAFFRAHRAFGLIILLTITLYHLSDYLRGPVINPFYHDVGYSKIEVGLIRTSVGLWATMAGVAASGFCAVRLGVFRTLIIGAVLQPIGIGLFALVALAGGPNLSLFAGVNLADDFSMAFAGVALVTYMSSLTSLGYTASQYAVMSSALAWTGKILKGFSGFVVEDLQRGRGMMQAYAFFFVGIAALGLPVIALCFLLERRARNMLQPIGHSAQNSASPRSAA